MSQEEEEDERGSFDGMLREKENLQQLLKTCTTLWSDYHSVSACGSSNTTQL